MVLVASTGKNIIMKFLEQENKRSADHTYTMIERLTYLHQLVVN
jgi:hypothetical protein